MMLSLKAKVIIMYAMYKCINKHINIHIKYTQCFMSIISQQRREKQTFE